MHGQPWMSLEYMSYFNVHIQSISKLGDRKNSIPLNIKNLNSDTLIYTFKVELRIVI